MVSWTIFALLRLDGLVIHMHVILDGGHIFMPQEFLEAKGVIAQDQIANGKGMAKDVRTNALVGDPCAFAQTSKELRHAIPGQWQACLGEKHVIFASTAPDAEFFLLGSMSIDVIEQIT